MNNREAFEAWYKKEIDAGECFMRNKDNPEHYLSLNVHFAYKCWQSALASQQDQLSSNPLQLPSQAQQPTDLSKQLREYAADSGYSHNDYADTMLAAAYEIERCVARLAASQAQQEPTKAANLFEIVTHGESRDAWLLLRADVNLGLGHHCIKFEGAAADDLRKRFKVMGSMQSQAQQPENKTAKFLADARDYMLTVLQKKLSTGDFDMADIQHACVSIDSFLNESQAQQTQSKPQEFVRYRHSKSDTVWFYQHTKFELPEWAIDVEPYTPPAPEGGDK